MCCAAKLALYAWRANLPSPGPDLIIEPAGQDDISSPGIVPVCHVALDLN